jgi:hypothetical protein
MATRRFIPNDQYPLFGDDIRSSELQSHFGGSSPVSLSNYYKGGGLVSDSDGDYLLGSNDYGVPESGKISFSNFSVRPFWDQHFFCSSVGVTTPHSFTIPHNRGYKHMRIIIQGSGGSGTVGAALINPPSGWGLGQYESDFGGSAATGGNGGAYAIKFQQTVSGGDVINIQVGAGGASSGGVYNNNAIAGSRGTFGTQFTNGGNNNHGAETYVKVNTTYALRVPGGLASYSKSKLTADYDVGAGYFGNNTRTLYSPSADNNSGSNGTNGSDIWLNGGQGGMGYVPYAYREDYGTGRLKVGGNPAAYGMQGKAGYGGAAAGFLASDQLSHKLRGRGYEIYSVNKIRLWSNYQPSGGYWRSQGVNAFMGRAGFATGYGFGGEGQHANYGPYASESGGDAFVRIMFFDGDYGPHITPSSGLDPDTPTFT